MPSCGGATSAEVLPRVECTGMQKRFDDQARVQMADIEGHMEETYFAWIGGSAPDSVFYYRIHSPVILLEFDHQRPAGLRHMFDPNQPMLEHIHTVVRVPNGNDYGKNLLREHYAAHPHPPAR